MKFKKTCLLISFHDKNSYSEETSYFPEITRLRDYKQLFLALLAYNWPLLLHGPRIDDHKSDE